MMPEKIYAFKSNPDWKLCMSENDFGDASPEDIIAVLESVKELFENVIGWSYVNRKPLIVKRGYDSPQVSRVDFTILLDITGNRWSQFIYQFSHELCHYMIDSDVPQRIRWFEETICEVASLFFLNRAATQWAHSPPYPNWYEYADKITAYCNKRKVQIAQYCHKNLSDFIYDNLHTLENDCYRRDENARIAIELLPVFECTPSLWKEIPKLGNLAPVYSFPSALRKWVLMADAENVSAMDSIYFLMTQYVTKGH